MRTHNQSKDWPWRRRFCSATWKQQNVGALFVVTAHTRHFSERFLLQSTVVSFDNIKNKARSFSTDELIDPFQQQNVHLSIFENLMKRKGQVQTFTDSDPQKYIEVEHKTFFIHVLSIEVIFQLKKLWYIVLFLAVMVKKLEVWYLPNALLSKIRLALIY